MNSQEKDTVVRLIASGKNSYKELRGTLPNITPLQWARLGHPESHSSDDVAQLDKKIDYMDTYTYKPVDEDTFHLTAVGENRLYELQKEDLKRVQTEKAIRLAEESNALAAEANKLSETANELSEKAVQRAEESVKLSVESNELSKSSNSLSEAANALARDSYETADKALKEAEQSKYIAMIAVIVTIITLLFSIFSG